jgi:hypothetical protein
MSMIVLTGVVPAVCDSEAGEVDRQSSDVTLCEFASECVLADQSRLTRLFRMIRARKTVQTFAQYFKNRRAASPKLGAPTIH